MGIWFVLAQPYSILQKKGSFSGDQSGGRAQEAGLMGAPGLGLLARVGETGVLNWNAGYRALADGLCSENRLVSKADCACKWLNNKQLQAINRY
jgi:hypothetical protein